MRAAYAALLLGVVGGLVLAMTVSSGGRGGAPRTIAAALDVAPAGPQLDRRRAEAAAVLLARCMTARGLGWEPWLEPAPDVPDAGLDPVTWAERWGFGVTTTVGRPAAVFAADPNLVRVGRLPPDDQKAYQRALGGDGRRPGCRTVSNDAVYGLRDRLLAPLRPALVSLDERIAQDAAAARILATWRSCVAAIGDARRSDRSTLAPILLEGFVTRLAALGRSVRTRPELAGLQDEERRVAAILARCDAAHDRARTAVAASFEAAFAKEHLAELRRIGTAIRDAEAALPTMPPLDGVRRSPAGRPTPTPGRGRAG